MDWNEPSEFYIELRVMPFYQLLKVFFVVLF